MVTAHAALEAVELTTRRARLAAARDLQQRYVGAREAAGEKARRLVSTARRDSTSQHLRYDPAARLLREWYLTAHSAFLDRGLGRQAATPDAAAVEESAAKVGRIRTGQNPRGPFQAAAYLLAVARTDAAAAVVTVYVDLCFVASVRAASYVKQPGWP